MSFQGLALARVSGEFCLKRRVDIGFMGDLAGSDAGGCPAATYFLCFAKESRQRKATRGSSPRQKRRGALRCSRVKAAAELGLEGAALLEIKVALALKQSSPTSPSLAPLLGDSHRDPVVLRRPLKKSVSPASLKGLPSVAAGAQFICDCPWQT